MRSASQGIRFREGPGTTTHDKSGNGNDGQFVTAATSPAWSRYGKHNYGLQFDGNDDYISTGNDPVQTNTITACSWIKPYAGDIVRVIVSNVDFLFYVYVGSDPTEKLVVTSDNGSHGVSSDTHSITLNAWQYVCAKRLSDGKTTFYINGIQSGAADQDSGTPTDISSTGLSIGARYDGAYSFSGLVDDVKIYNYARTPAQIAWDFNGGKPVAEWDFDECSGGTIHDSAVSWNGGTANNGQLYLGTSGVTATGTCASSSDSFWYNGKDGKVNQCGEF